MKPTNPRPEEQSRPLNALVAASAATPPSLIHKALHRVANNNEPTESVAQIAFNLSFKPLTPQDILSKRPSISLKPTDFDLLDMKKLNVQPNLLFQAVQIEEPGNFLARITAFTECAPGIKVFADYNDSIKRNGRLPPEIRKMIEKEILHAAIDKHDQRFKAYQICGSRMCDFNDHKDLSIEQKDALEAQLRSTPQCEWVAAVRATLRRDEYGQQKQICRMNSTIWDAYVFGNDTTFSAAVQQFEAEFGVQVRFGLTGDLTSQPYMYTPYHTHPVAFLGFYRRVEASHQGPSTPALEPTDLAALKEALEALEMPAFGDIRLLPWLLVDRSKKPKRPFDSHPPSLSMQLLKRGSEDDGQQEDVTLCNPFRGFERYVHVK